MDNTPSENKVLGIPTQKYLKICYMLILVSAGFGVLANLLGLGGVYIGGGIIAMLLGLTGIALAVTGWQIDPDKFNEMEISHFRYLIILFVGFFALSMIFAGIFGSLGAIGQVIVLLVSIAQFVCVYTGFTVWKNAQEATKPNLINGFNSLKAKIIKS